MPVQIMAPQVKQEEQKKSGLDTALKVFDTASSVYTAAKKAPETEKPPMGQDAGGPIQRRLDKFNRIA
jgi:hypothetical protein